MSTEVLRSVIGARLSGIQVGGVLGVTGHRPERLGGPGDELHRRLVRVAAIAIKHAGASKVIIGMAQGWDMACAEACISLKIPFVAAVPFSAQASRWPEKVRSRYHALLDKAAEIVVVSPGDYEYWKMQARNKWIVDTCDSLLSLWDLAPDGGTASCVAYAASRKRPVFNMFPVLAISERAERDREEEKARLDALVAAKLRGAA